MSGIDEVVAAERFEAILRMLSTLDSRGKAEHRRKIAARERAYEREHERMNEWTEIIRRFRLEARRDGNWNWDQEGRVDE